MAKKNDDIDIEEILLRQVAGRYEEQETPSELVTPTPPRNVDLRLKNNLYEELFLRENPVRERSVVYVSGDTKRKLSQVAHRLGGSKFSVTALVDNILSNHLSVFRDEINRLHKMKNRNEII